MPKDAELGDDESFAWSDWPGLRWQIEHSPPGEYLRPPKEMVLREHYCRRWVLDTGETVPVTCAVDCPWRPCDPAVVENNSPT